MKKLKFGFKNTHVIKLEAGIVQKMLLGLCKKHRPFNDFYSENEADIDKLKINWIINTKIRVEGIASPITDTITLKKYPDSLEDARIVAHEIEHFLIWNRGYPYVIPDIHGDVEVIRKHDKFSKVFQDIIFEPMVESRLKKYFGSLCSDNLKDAMGGLKKLIKIKENILVEIKDSQALLYYSCLYVKRRLLIEVTCDNDEADEYIRIFNDNFGENIVPCAEKIIFLIKKNDLTSPKSVKIIIEKIIQNQKFGFIYQSKKNSIDSL